jgi:hypothetical protein
VLRAVRNGEATGAVVTVGERERQAPGGDESFPPEVGGFLTQETPPGPRRELMEEVLSKVLEWGDVEPVRGISEKRKNGHTRYLRLHRPGSHKGAFAYIHGRRSAVSVRLPNTRARGTKFARGRNVVERNPYQLVSPVRTPEHVEEALALMREAYEAALD